MSKKSKSLKRRGVGTVQDIHSHHRIVNYLPHQYEALEKIDKGFKPGELMIIATGRNGGGIGKTRLMSLREHVAAGGSLTDEDIGIHRNEGP